MEASAENNYSGWQWQFTQKTVEKNLHSAKTNCLRIGPHCSVYTYSYAGLCFLLRTAKITCKHMVHACMRGCVSFEVVHAPIVDEKQKQ